MSYLKKPKNKDRLNVQVIIKDYEGTVTKITLEECDPDKIAQIVGADFSPKNIITMLENDSHRPILDVDTEAEFTDDN
jgi:hypothetical protein